MRRFKGFLLRCQNHIARRRRERLQAAHGGQGPEVIWSGYYFEHKLPRSIARAFYRFYDRRLIQRNADARVLVICHIFYYSALPELRQYLNNLAPYRCKYIFTYVKDCCCMEELERLRSYGDVELRPYSNSGYDLAPFFDVLAGTDLSDYDVVIKLHTKTTERERFVYGQRFGRREWFLRLFDGIVGAHTVHRMIDVLRANNNVGLVAESKCLDFNDPPYIRRMVAQQLERRGLPAPIEDYRFVGGTCFAARPQALEYIKQLGVGLNDFEHVRYGTFGLAHALERELCSVILANGYTFERVATHPLLTRWSRSIAQRKYQSSTRNLPAIYGLRFADDDLLCLDWFFYATHRLISVKLGDLSTFDAQDKPHKLSDIAPDFIKRNGERWQHSSEADAFIDTHFMVANDQSLADLDEVPWSQAVIVDQDRWIVCGHDTAYSLYATKGPDAIIDVIQFVHK